MPNLIRNNLVIRRLLHKTNPGALLPLVNFRQRPAGKADFPLPFPVRSQHRFQLPQQR